jgi:gamma-glutamylcyclotransferase (GGCT)/AIG2-like uncharacterized protein YtfP
MYAFVYGTLRKGDSRFGVLDGCECVAAEAYLDDFQMLHLGGFPGIIHGAGRVRGEVYEIDDDILAMLDGIEGYREDDPKHSLYLRETIHPVHADGGSVGECLTYVYNVDRWRDSDRPYKIVESGDWFDVSPPRRLYSAS